VKGEGISVGTRGIVGPANFGQNLNKRCGVLCFSGKERAQNGITKGNKLTSRDNGYDHLRGVGATKYRPVHCSKAPGTCISMGIGKQGGQPALVGKARGRNMIDA